MKNRQALVAVPTLTAEQASDVGALVRVCREYDRIEGILNEESSGTVLNDETNQFLYYENGTLAGILTLPSSRHIEMLGMVHPDYRRRGIGRTLLEAGKAECQRRGVPDFLLICEDPSPAGKAFAEAMQGTYRFAEHRMKWHATAFTASLQHTEKITLARVDAADREMLIHLESAAFGDQEELCREWITRWFTEPNQRFYIGKWGEQAVGLIRVAFDKDAVDLCTFGVLPEHRGRGFGRQILEQVIQDVLPEGKTIYIEVETKNDTALSLYLSCGFQSVATFRYYEFPV